MPPKAKPPAPVAQQPPALLDRDGFVTSEELADYLKVPIGTLDQWASRGGGPEFRKIGKFRRYDPVWVKSWLAEQPRGGVPPAA